MAEQLEVNAAVIEQAHLGARKERREIIQEQVDNITKCDGSDPTLVRQWISEVQLIDPTLANDVRIHIISKSVTGAFRLELEAFMRQQQDRGQTPWENIRDHMLAAFVSPDHQEYQKGALAKIKQLPGETIVRYNMRFREAAQEAYPGARNADQNRELVKLYGKGLAKHIDDKKLVAQDWPATLEDALDRMSTRETGNERYHHLGRPEEDMEVNAVQEKPPSKSSVENSLEQIISKIASLEASQKVLSEKVSEGTHKVHRVPRTPGSAADKRDRGSRGVLECYECGKRGHFARDCWHRKRNRGNKSGQPRHDKSSKN